MRATPARSVERRGRINRRDWLIDVTKPILGIIGGSGFYQMSALERPERIELNTPFGSPSDAYYRGSIGGTDVIFLARHGRGHTISPSELNSRANVFGMKQ